MHQVTMFGDLSAREGTDAVGDGLRRSNMYVLNPSCKGVVRSDSKAEVLASRGVESIGNLIL